MEKIGLISRDKELAPQLKKAIKNYSFIYDQKNPDLILTVGGDGTLLYAERLYPEIPKLPIKYKSLCHKCAAFDIHHVLQSLKEGNYKETKIQKLEVLHKGKTLQALNDIIIRNKHQWAALRFSLEVDEKPKGDFIGDGIVASTSFGSTGYFQSITGKNIKNGFAIALNNVHSHPKSPHLFFKKNIVINILREKAVVSADNNPKSFSAKENDALTISPKGKTSIISIHP